MKILEKPRADKAVLVEIDQDSQDQRIDNFLTKLCKGVPKSHLFRIIRSGEVRVNGKRVQAKHKLVVGDQVRVPPLQTANASSGSSHDQLACEPSDALCKLAASIPIVFEDDCILVINKPAGLAVHGGSGNSLGVIELLRMLRANSHDTLELVHRIDRETSGLLIVSKKRSALRKLQEQLRKRVWKKFYSTLVLGDWPQSIGRVDLSLTKIQASEKEKRVFVDPAGEKASTIFTVVKRMEFKLSRFTLLQAQILTGKTHQIRVHTSANGFPIACDDRYGNFEFNKFLSKNGLKRMFLHAEKIQILHPATEETLTLHAPLAPELQRFLNSMKAL